MDFDIQNLSVINAEAALNSIDLTSFNNDYNKIYDETKSANYVSIKPSELVDPLDLTEIDDLKSKTSTTLNEIQVFINKVKEFDNSDDGDPNAISDTPLNDITY